MKRSQIILLSITLVTTGMIYLVLKSNQKDSVKTIKKENKVIHIPVREVSNQKHMMTLVSYGQITPNKELNVSFEVQGKLLKGDIEMKPGTNFKKGQVLYFIDKEEAKLSLSARKAGLSSLIISFFADIELDFPAERDKWMNFLNALNAKKVLPVLPEMNSPKEKMFFTSRNVITEHINLISLEYRLTKYAYIAEFNGTVTQIYAEPGSIINPGVQIAKIVQTGDYEVKVPVDMRDIELYKNEAIANFVDSENKKVGTGKIRRISDFINQQTQSADVYYSITPDEGVILYNGMFVNVTIDQEVAKSSMIIPRTALKDKKVNVLKDNKIEPVVVLSLGSIPDSVYVSGLKDGQMLILEQMENIDKAVTYKGTNR